MILYWNREKINCYRLFSTLVRRRSDSVSRWNRLDRSIAVTHGYLTFDRLMNTVLQRRAITFIRSRTSQITASTWRQNDSMKTDAVNRRLPSWTFHSFRTPTLSISISIDGTSVVLNPIVEECPDVMLYSVPARQQIVMTSSLSLSRFDGLFTWLAKSWTITDRRVPSSTK